jgi:hypothetical protein
MKNLNEEEILDYLMTSDFSESLSPDELKNLLLKFRHFYRINFSRSNSIEMEKKRFDYEIEQLKIEKQSEINNLSDSNTQLLNIYKSITSRKLTFLERLLGKIKPKSNEII